jgi:predicted MFS family arabinose efflux permease
LVAVALGWLFVLGARFLLPALLPQIKQTFGIGNAEGGIAISILWGLYALVQLPAGVLIDRHGERRLLTASLIASGGAVGLLGLAPAFWIFLVGCAIFGFGSGLFGPPRGTVLSRAFPANDNAAIGLTLASGSLGSAVLLFGAGRLVGLVDWSGIMLALVCPFVVLAGLIWWAVPARTDEPQAVPDDSDTITGDIRRALGYPSVVGAAIGVALSLFVLQGLTSFLPTYLVENRVYSEETATALFAAVFVSGAVTRLIGGIIADRTDERVVLVGWGILGTVALGSLPLVTGLVPIAAVLVIVGGALFGLTPVSNAYIIASLPDDITGAAWGMLRTGFFLIGAGGSTAVGVLADHGFLRESFWVLSGIAAIATLAYGTLSSRGRADGC